MSVRFLVARTESAVKVMAELEHKDERKYRKVRKTLGLLSQDPKHLGLNSHKLEAEKSDTGADIWESYVENNTPAA